jgi:hypothetical protein
MESEQGGKRKKNQYLRKTAQEATHFLSYLERTFLSEYVILSPGFCS